MFALWRLWRRIGGWRALLAQAMLAWRLARDKRVPRRTKLILAAPVAYFFTPINLSFGWIPVIGQIDNLGVTMLAIAAFLKACPDEVVLDEAKRLEAEMTSSSRWRRFGWFRRYVTPSFDRWTRRASSGRRGGPGNATGEETHPRAPAAPDSPEERRRAPGAPPGGASPADRAA